MKRTQTTFRELSEKINAIPTPRGDIGKVQALVVRPERGMRQLVNSMRVTPEGGIDGDRWGKVKQSSRRRQVSMIRADILDIFSNRENQELSGDNIHVDFDLSHENLPTGARVRIGTVILKVSPMKHLPCEQFIDRFGATSYEVANSNQMLAIRARGVLLEVVEGGIISLNDSVRPV